MSKSLKVVSESCKPKTKLTKIELENLLAEVQEELSEAQLQLEELIEAKEKLSKAKPIIEAYSELTKELGPVEQVRVAFAGENRLALVFGSVFGGFIPLASYFVVHNEVGWTSHGIAMLVIALGALAFSAKTVWQWGNEVFKHDGWKAGGFVLLLEGVMTLSNQSWLGYAALSILMFVNAVATGVTAARR